MIETLTSSILFTIIGIFIGAITVLVYNSIQSAKKVSKAEQLVLEHKKEADRIRKEAVLEAKEEAHRLKIETDKFIKERKAEIANSENRLLKRETNMDRRSENLDNREQLLENREKNLVTKQQKIQEMESEVEAVLSKQMSELERIAGYTASEAHDIIMRRVEDEMSQEITAFIKEREEEAKVEADKRAKNLLVLAMQKYASDQTNETTITVVNLPNDDMKGRIIGREGRNIRTFEALTGVDLIIDDTPEAVVLSGFDPIRREVARRSLESLLKDGRIHPARIEELVEKTRKEVNNYIREIGEEAIFDLGIKKPSNDIIKLLGRLNFRTSYGQNVLQHSKEVAYLSGILAAEIGEDQQLAKRAGLLHDIGKAIDHEVEGSHVELGMEIAKRYNEHKVVLNAIGYHHGDFEANNPISVIVAAADALSAARPGARSDSLEHYIKRLEKLEEITSSFNGVDKSFAVQAGREVRIIVKPDQVDDLASHRLAREIKTKIEEEMHYPGTIKVTVIRETRAVEEAK